MKSTLDMKQGKLGQKAGQGLKDVLLRLIAEFWYLIVFSNIAYLC